MIFVSQKSSNDSFREAAKRKMSITSSAATMRVLSVLRHWVTKHGQDFDGNHHLKNLTIEFLEDIVCTRTLLPAEHKAASQLLRYLVLEIFIKNKYFVKHNVNVSGC